MITLENVSKKFNAFQAISSVSLHIQPGEIHGIIGASGAGKSTLLRLMNLLEIPDEGEVTVNGHTLTAMNSKQLREARKSIGMIFQHFNLAANKTVYGNVAVSLELAGFPKKQQRSRVMECLQFVGLEDYAQSYPAQLSGGQKQRVAIARALANKPQVLLCDEPTSALDPRTTAELLGVLEEISRLGVTIVIVSHEMNVIKSICSRVTVMADGKVYDTIERQPQGIVKKENRAQYFVDELKKDGEAGDA
ncbi:ATP-binding cassette domain-containing protein [Metabacillus sp. KIGAM252]|uniref:ATP-binding cassette domain-containing protein n=1 Tax=Metabacillus flavus TaxID=2823519 RepID=A0ABS5LK00_9BACI|nr:ATP-binding cassette domain-containing protein [Metabacillus flavus]MBS2971052.1 ATP-binding cassette domain-containing protein [Metabacillus flavus]